MFELKEIIPPRKQNSHKGDYGHVLVLAGSPGLTGAAYLCSQAALLSGCGLVTLGILRGLNPIMEIKLTEVMTKPLPETKDLTLSLAAFPPIFKLVKSIDALALGPGLSQNRQTQALIRKLVISVEKPIVLDADGINAFVRNIKLLRKVKAPLIITPHPGEMARLLNLKVEEVQNKREDLAQDFARKHNLMVVLKGYHTVVADYKQGLYTNETGNPGMATAGSGDILTGMIAGFMAQNITPFNAAKLAVYLHGLAGDLAAKEKGQTSLIASDILHNLPQAIKQSLSV